MGLGLLRVVLVLVDLLLDCLLVRILRHLLRPGAMDCRVIRFIMRL